VQEIGDDGMNKEMDEKAGERAYALLWDIGRPPKAATSDQWLAAYSAVLLKEVLVTLMEIKSHLKSGCP